MTRARVLLTVCLSVLAATSAWSQQSPPSSNNGSATTGAQEPRPTGIMKPRNAAGTAATTGGNLIDHGGPVLPISTTYAVWWGDPAAFPADAQAGVDSSGSAAGYFSDSSGLPHAFVRTSSGAFSTPKAPGASYGTVARSINDSGAIAGYATTPTK